MTDPIRAKLDVLAQWGDFVGPVSELVDALRAVLDLHIEGVDQDCAVCLAEYWPCPTLQAIAESLGVTDG